MKLLFMRILIRFLIFREYRIFLNFATLLIFMRRTSLESSEPIEPAPPLSLAIKWHPASWTIPYRKEPSSFPG